MSGRIFQNVVLQFKETTDRTIGVIDAEGTVIACSELTGVGKKWPQYVEPINAAEGNCVTLEGKTFRVFGAAYTEEKSSKTPGTIISAGEDGICFACADGSCVRITELQAPGKKRMKAADFLRGHRIRTE